MYSKNYANALKNVLPKLKELHDAVGTVGSAATPVEITATFYAAKGGREPDLDGALVGLGDLLERSGIIDNDRYIKSWDGSRVHSWSEHQQYIDGLTVFTINRFEE